jgi:hypothetical protein
VDRHRVHIALKRQNTSERAIRPAWRAATRCLPPGPACARDDRTATTSDRIRSDRIRSERQCRLRVPAPRESRAQKAHAAPPRLPGGHGTSALRPRRRWPPRPGPTTAPSSRRRPTQGTRRSAQEQERVVVAGGGRCRSLACVRGVALCGRQRSALASARGACFGGSSGGGWYVRRGNVPNTRGVASQGGLESPWVDKTLLLDQVHARTHAHASMQAHAHARIRTHAYTRTHARTSTHACTRTHVHACTRARTHAHTHECTHARMHTRRHACERARTHACARTHGITQRKAPAA